MAKVLNLPTQIHCMFLASQCEAYIVTKHNAAFRRWIVRLHSSGNNRSLFMYSHFSHRIALKKLLTMIEKRLHNHQIQRAQLPNIARAE
jgi:hypothetical protein